MADVALDQRLGLVGLSPDDAVTILGNEIQLNTLRVLWHDTVTTTSMTEGQTIELAFDLKFQGLDTTFKQTGNTHDR